jgi:hypothetical protein
MVEQKNMIYQKYGRKIYGRTKISSNIPPSVPDIKTGIRRGDGEACDVTPDGRTDVGHGQHLVAVAAAPAAAGEKRERT